LAILRYKEMGRLLIHRGLRQGSHAWPEHNGVGQGLFADWTPDAVAKMLPEFERITTELIDDFIAGGHCDFMSQFADPYAGRVLTMLLGMPDEMSAQILKLAADMGLALGVTYKESLPIIEAATKQMYDLVAEVLAERRGAAEFGRDAGLCGGRYHPQSAGAGHGSVPQTHRAMGASGP